MRQQTLDQLVQMVKNNDVLDRFKLKLKPKSFSGWYFSFQIDPQHLMMLFTVVWIEIIASLQIEWADTQQAESLPVEGYFLSWMSIWNKSKN